MQELNNNSLFFQIESLVSTIEIRDAYTQGHSRRVAEYAVQLAKWLELSESISDSLKIAGMLHDLGKIGIPDEILLKPGHLGDVEYGLIKMHSLLSEKIIEKIALSDDIRLAVRHHHENYNGSGYPDKLKDVDIPLMARILTIADVFDALTTQRIYRKAMNMEKALSLMETENNHGKFDPDICNVFRENIQAFGILDDTHLKEFAYPELEERRTSFLFKHQITSLLNRAALLAFLRKGADMGESAFLAEINIRNFSEYNKSYGLIKGDELLRRVAQHLLDSLGASCNFEDPKSRLPYIFHGYADRFYLLELGFRSAFLICKLEELGREAETKHSISLYWRVMLNGEKISSNIEKKIGYLL